MSMRTRHTIISGRRRKINSRRSSEQYENAVLLSVHKVLLRSCHDLQEHASEACKLRADYLNNIPPCAAVMEDDDVRNNFNVEF